jgi:hypothetical protein
VPALITLAAVQQYLSIKPGGDADPLLSNMIDRVSAAVLNYLNRGDIMASPRTETRNGTSSARMVCANLPVQSVQSVRINGAEVLPSTGYSVPGWSFDAEGVILRGGLTFTRGTANVELSYVAGYDEVPADIALAVLEAVGLAFKRREHVDVSSKSLAGETITYITADMPPSARKVLDNYRKVIPA